MLLPIKIDKNFHGLEFTLELYEKYNDKIIAELEKPLPDSKRDLLLEFSDLYEKEMSILSNKY